MKAQKITIIVLSVLLIITVLGSVILLGISTDSFKDLSKFEISSKDSLGSNAKAESDLKVFVDEEHNAEVVENDMGVIVSEVKLSSSGVTTVDNTLQKTLTATILPSNAVNKKVDWSVAWGENPKSDDVSNYIEVKTTEDGSATATVVCKKNFEGSTIIITCKMRAGDFSAECVCSYDGAPLGFNLIRNGETFNSGAHFDFTAGDDVEFDLCLVNPLGVGSSYGTYEVESIKGYGIFYVEHFYRYNGTITVEHNKMSLIDLSGQYAPCGAYLYDASGNKTDTFKEYPLSSILQIYGLNNGIVDLDMFGDETSCVAGNRTGGGYRYLTRLPDLFPDFLLDTIYNIPEDYLAIDPYFEVVIKEMVSGQTFSFTVHINASTEA